MNANDYQDEIDRLKVLLDLNPVKECIRMARQQAATWREGGAEEIAKAAETLAQLYEWKWGIK